MGGRAVPVRGPLQHPDRAGRLEPGRARAVAGPARPAERVGDPRPVRIGHGGSAAARRRRGGPAEPAGVRGGVLEARRLGPRGRARRRRRLGDRRVAGKPVRRSLGPGRERRRHPVRPVPPAAATAQRRAGLVVARRGPGGGRRPLVPGPGRPRRVIGLVHRCRSTLTVRRRTVTRGGGPRGPERSRSVTESRRIRGGMTTAIAGRRSPPRARLLRSPLRQQRVEVLARLAPGPPAPAGSVVAVIRHGRFGSLKSANRSAGDDLTPDGDQRGWYGAGHPHRQSPTDIHPVRVNQNCVLRRSPFHRKSGTVSTVT